ncbi:MAG: zinc-responsive transcriptional regulator [Halobacteriovorax sp.]|nr:zinc-responsive transcriptional regulator [Halobacteriovorax sp.]|tara:strand:- start:11982 stop:12398 length:417 start_codon:yes stop_codon:yes gene_type:complete
MDELLKIGQLAKKSGASIDAIRFYEDKGLIKPTSRSSSGYRYYNLDAVNTLNFVQSAKELGFTLSEISDFLEIQISKNGKCSLAQEKINDKLNDIETKISNLKSIKKALTKVSKKCETSENSDPCHFLEVLGGIKNGR